MSLFGLRKGASVRIDEHEFVLHQRLSDNNWQLQDAVTGEWRTFTENDLLERYARKELSFVVQRSGEHPLPKKLSEKLARDLATFSPQLIAIARNRVQYLKEIDRRQPIVLQPKTIQPLIKSISERIRDPNPPGWCTVYRDYRKWLAAARDVRAIILRYADRGRRGTRLPPEVTITADQVIEELYLTPERKRVPEVHLEVIRRLTNENRFRPRHDQLPIPSRRTMYREIARRSPYEAMVARYGKRRADMEFRLSMRGVPTSHALERVVMDHTPGDIIIVDDRSMLPLGRPTITSALDEHTRCLTGFYAGFEPPSCLAVMRCLKHAILPKTYISREFPSVKNCWECYGVPETVVVDNPPEFHSSHFERACLQIGCEIQYAKVRVPWYKGKLERFQGTMSHDLMHGQPGTTFSNILERDEYDASKHAVVLLSTFREILHKWIVDVYLQAPHRGLKDIPAHKWHKELVGLPPPLPPSATELDIVLGMTAHRVVFHYGIELEGLTYNDYGLGELRRRMGSNPKVELTFDPGDLGLINVLDPLKGTYICVPAVNQAYAKGLSLWQNKVIRRYALRELNGRTDTMALAQAKAEIRALVERDFHRKSTRGRKRIARFMEDHAKGVLSERARDQTPLADSHCVIRTVSYEVCEPHPRDTGFSSETQRHPSHSAVLLESANYFTDDEPLPVFEAGLDLPRPTVSSAIRGNEPSASKGTDA
jgi:putative transposase